MSKRAGKTYPQQSEQWYVEPASMVEQIFDALDFGGGTIWDASCGGGTTLNVARTRGYRTRGTDIVDRGIGMRGHWFERHDFLRLREPPFRVGLGERVSLLCNPPYGKVGGVSNMGTRFVEHARKHFRDSLYRMAFIVPIEFAAGQERFELYDRDRPSHLMIASQRPSMLSGELLEQGRKAKGGMADYAVIVWTRGGPWRCETIWMRPDSIAPFIERRKR